jgi:hypothetical protein
MNNRATAALLGVGLCGTLFAGACARRAPPPPPGPFHRGPILLVGVVGFEWYVVMPLLRRGRLPHIAGLMRRGSYGLLESRRANSPALWTSIATGKTIEKHGIRDFLKRNDPPELYASTDRRTKAFWNVLTDFGRRVHCVGWYVTYPVEAINGVMVAQTSTDSLDQQRGLRKGSLLKGVPGQVHPPERENEFFADIDAVDAGLEEAMREVTPAIVSGRSLDTPTRFGAGCWVPGWAPGWPGGWRQAPSWAGWAAHSGAASSPSRGPRVATSSTAPTSTWTVPSGGCCGPRQGTRP